MRRFKAIPAAALEDNTPAVDPVGDPAAEPAEELVSASADDAEASADEAAASDEDFDQSQLEAAAVEALGEQAAALEALIESKACTPQTLTLARMAAQQQLNILGATLPAVSLESDDIVAQHQIVLEGVLEAVTTGLKDYAQAVVMNVKNTNDYWDDIFSRYQTILNKYERVLSTAKTDVGSAKSSFESGEHVASLNGLWQFFANHKGEVTDPVGEVKKDLPASTFMLVAYPKAVLGELGKLTSILNGAAPADDGALGDVLTKIEKLQDPVELFDTKFLTNGQNTLLDASGIEGKIGTTRSPLTLEGKSFARLADISTAKSVQMTRGLKHRLKKNLLGGNADSYDHVKLSTADLETLLKSGEAYLKNAESFLATKASMQSKIVAFGEAAKKFAGASKAPSTRKALGQIKQYGENLLNALKTPASKELNRSLLGGRNCAYLARATAIRAPKAK